jgi:copper chaperone NosL
MFIFQAKHPEDIVRAWFVHDYTTETWIRGETAFYVMSSEIHSPMGYGVIAFESNAAAERFASELNEPQYYTFDEIRTLIETRP